MLPEIKKVLYATDLSRNSAFAFRYAMKFAEEQNADIVILHVLEEIAPNTKALMSLYLAESELRNVLNEKLDVTEEIKDRLNTFCDQEYRDAPACTSRVAHVEEPPVADGGGGREARQAVTPDPRVLDDEVGGSRLGRPDHQTQC